MIISRDLNMKFLSQGRGIFQLVCKCLQCFMVTVLITRKMENESQEYKILKRAILRYDRGTGYTRTFSS